MIRTALLASLVAAGLATPVLANEQTPADTADAASVQAFTAQLSWRANQQQLRKMLAHQGYVVTSDLNRADSGYLTGTALKDGKQVIVGVKMPPRMPAPALTN